ncbi:MAG TPA: single-stranded DNA-binding protein [Actinoplanes sp.]|nr:single-stranded DNA-binding protein [Actinoplanes sp.]
MFETNIVIVGNVLTAPEWRRTNSKGTLLAHFRVASTARRLDKETGRWVDGDSLRVRVTCWRKLAEGVGASIAVGDPVVVVGRLYTRDWTDSEGNARVSYEMEAVAVGHDLARGKARFFRNRPTGVDASADGPESDAMVRGEAAELVPDDEVPAAYGDGVPDGEEPTLADTPQAEFDPVPALADFDGGFSGHGDSRSAADDDLSPVGGEMEIEIEALGGESDGRRRARRAGRRQPVPA